MKQFTLADDILVQNIDNEAVIVSPEGGMITTINETGAFLIAYIKEHNSCTQKELIEVLSKEYNVQDELVITDIELFLKEMIENKILIT